MQHRVLMIMTSQGAPQENPYAEQLMSTIKKEKVYLAKYQDPADALMQIGLFTDGAHQKKRIHSALGYHISAEFESAY